MHPQSGKLCPLLVLLFAAAPCWATADHIVTVGNGAGSFDPKDLVIEVGDTVTFIMTDATESHNVHANDDSFRCAVGCRGVDASATGDPSKQAWSDTLTFNTPGVIGYRCDPHAQYGMVGSITVNSVGQNIIGGLSGNWFDPTANQGGHGFQIEILPNNGILAIWFVFNPAGTAQTWIYSQGSYDPTSNSVSIDAFLEQGQGLAFPPNYNSSNLTATPWGTLQFAFTDCNNGTVHWRSNATSLAAGYADTSFPIQRLTSISGTACP